ncbi:MAG: LuxR C-terminal-related transcriptional regulator [Solirubrobacterales bacterium]
MLTDELLDSILEQLTTTGSEAEQVSVGGGRTACALSWESRTNVHLAIARSDNAQQTTAALASSLCWLRLFEVGSDHLAEAREQIGVAQAAFILMRRISESFAASDDLEQSLQSTMRNIVGLLQLDAGSISIIDSSQGALVTPVHVGYSPEYVSGIAHWGLEEGLAGLVMQTAEPMVIEDLLTHPMTARRDLIREARWRAWACFPLRHSDSIEGVVEFLAHEPGVLNHHEQELLRSIAAQLAFLIHTNGLYQEVLGAREHHIESLTRRLAQTAESQAHERERIRLMLAGGSVQLAAIEERLLMASAKTDAADTLEAALRLVETYRTALGHLEDASNGEANIKDRTRRYAERLSQLKGIKVSVRTPEAPIQLSGELEASSYNLVRDMLGRLGAADPPVDLALELRHEESDLLIEARQRARASLPAESALPKHLHLQFLKDQTARLHGTLETHRADHCIVLRCTFPIQAPSKRAPQLTEREREILRHVAMGMSSSAIAAELSISEKTVRNHLTTIYRKIEVSNRAQAVRYAIHQGLVAS